MPSKVAISLMRNPIEPISTGDILSCTAIPSSVRYWNWTVRFSNDNAHAVKPPKKFKYAGRILAFDHKHRHICDKGIPYEFKDAQHLLEDFFRDVDLLLRELRGK